MNFFEQEDLLCLKELGIDPYDTVFCKFGLLSPAKPLSKHFSKDVEKGGDIDSLAKELLSKLQSKKNGGIYVCRLRLNDGLYEFAPPEPVESLPNEKKASTPDSIAKHISITEKKLLAVNNSHIKKLMASAKKNAEFIERFNGELFFKHCFYKGERIGTAQLFSFYATHPYNALINLTSDADKQPFVALYAMTFYACSIDDLFTIDGIFSLQPERHADNAKKTAGNSVFNLILRGDKAEIDHVLQQMGQMLVEIEVRFPRVNLSDAVMLAKNYTRFVGLSEAGRVFYEIAKDNKSISFEALQACQALMKYAPLVALCDTISALAVDDDYRKTSVYKRCKELF